MINVAKCVKKVQGDDELIEVLLAMATAQEKLSSEDGDPGQYERSILHSRLQQKSKLLENQSDNEMLSTLFNGGDGDEIHSDEVEREIDRINVSSEYGLRHNNQAEVSHVKEGEEQSKQENGIVNNCSAT